MIDWLVKKIWFYTTMSKKHNWRMFNVSNEAATVV